MRVKGIKEELFGLAARVGFQNTGWDGSPGALGCTRARRDTRLQLACDIQWHTTARHTAVRHLMDACFTWTHVAGSVLPAMCTTHVGGESAARV